MEFEKETDGIGEKIGEIDIEINKKEKLSNSYAESDIKDQITYKKIHGNRFVEQINADLNNEQIAQKSAQTTILMLRKKLEEKRNQIEMMKNPRSFQTELPKNFLASEKLASAKKRKSLSPRKMKFKRLPTSQTTKRLKSVMKF